jgi:sugar lactone lactonase YvrE
VDSAINVYVADAHRIRKIFQNVISAVAATGAAGFSGDNGPALAARLNSPVGIALDSGGNLYIADTANHRIRRIANGVINTVAGSGVAGFSGDNGVATTGVALDAADNLYIADSGNNRIRKVSSGVITTVAGNGSDGYSGDNGPATSAQIQAANVAADAAGNVYVVDQRHHVIRKVTNGTITTVAGNGSPGYSGDNGLAANAQLFGPAAAALDATGSLYIADTTNSRIRKVANGVITTVAGNGAQGIGGDGGAALNAPLNLPNGIATDSAGKIYITDGGVRIRVLTPVASSCGATVTPSPVQAPVLGGNIPVGIQIAASCPWTVSALPFWITVSGAASGTGPASVTLAVAPNAGQARSATILIAGVSVVVNQAAALGCVTSIGSGGQGFAASGGSGSLAVNATPGCTWIASSNASWITFTGPSSGTGNGILTYQVAANTGAARSGVIGITGFSFALEQASLSTTEMTGSGAMAQLASAGSWKTTITLVNTDSAPQKIRLSFFDDNGIPLALPLTFPQAPLAAGTFQAAVLDRTIDTGATLIIETTGPDAQAVSVGWAQLLYTGSINGSAVFQQTAGARRQEATVPLETRNAGSYILSFDNISAAATGIALSSTSGPGSAIGIVIRDDAGALLLSSSITMPALGHTAFDLANNYVVAKDKRGTVELVAPADGHISVLGLRFNSTGAFTTILPFVK